MTLPLLLVAVAPLMIASFAFNFNNFNNIYLLTGGGPYTGESTIAGNTDILISYTYKIAIATGKGGLRPRQRVRDHHLLRRRRDLGHLVLANQGTGERHEMSEQPKLASTTYAAVAARGTCGQASVRARARSSRTRGGDTSSA